MKQKNKWSQEQPSIKSSRLDETTTLKHDRVNKVLMVAVRRDEKLSGGVAEGCRGDGRERVGGGGVPVLFTHAGASNLAIFQGGAVAGFHDTEDDKAAKCADARRARQERGRINRACVFVCKTSQCVAKQS